MNSTGVAHSISLTSVNTALRASDTAASIGYWRPISDVNSSSAKTIAARSLIANCIATTAGTPSATRLVAIPANGSVSVVRAPSQELRIASRSDVWSPSRFVEDGLGDLRRAALVVLEEQQARHRRVKSLCPT